MKKVLNTSQLMKTTNEAALELIQKGTLSIIIQDLDRDKSAERQEPVAICIDDVSVVVKLLLLRWTYQKKVVRHCGQNTGTRTRCTSGEKAKTNAIHVTPFSLMKWLV